MEYFMKKNVRVIQSIQRAFDIIDCFDGGKNFRLTLPEISSMLDLNISTTRGIINTLIANGYIEHDTDKNDYMLGMIYLSKSDLINSSQMERIRDFVRPFLDELAQKYEASARFQLVSNGNIFTIETVNPVSAHYIVFTKMYQAFPLHATASGKLFLHYLPSEQQKMFIDKMEVKHFTRNTIFTTEALEKELKKISKQGYATEFEEIGYGVSSIALPVIINKNVLFGTISLTAFTTIIKDITNEALIDMQTYAYKIAKKVSHK